MSQQFEQLGLTLLELMISISLGLVLSITVLSGFVSNKQTYAMNEAVTRLQENARFAHRFLTNVARNSGGLGCINRVRNKLNDLAYYNLSAPVIGYEYAGTAFANEPFKLIVPSKKSGLTKWHIALPDFLKNDKIVIGSDIIAFKSIEQTNIQLNQNLSTDLLTTKSKHDINNNSILLVGDCVQAELFKLNGATENTLASKPSNQNPDNISSNWGRPYSSNSRVYQVFNIYYYIALNTTGTPSLYRVKHDMHPNKSPRREELIDGVETMQISYGEDTDDDGMVNRYRNAATVQNWGNIVNLRIGLLMRSIAPVTESKQQLIYTLNDGVSFKAKKPDKFIRYASSLTIKLRNSGLANRTKICSANQGTCNEL